jgi:hypothetical protein
MVARCRWLRCVGRTLPLRKRRATPRQVYHRAVAAILHTYTCRWIKSCVRPVCTRCIAGASQGVLCMIIDWFALLLLVARPPRCPLFSNGPAVPSHYLRGCWALVSVRCIDTNGDSSIWISLVYRVSLKLGQQERWYQRFTTCHN